MSIQSQIDRINANVTSTYTAAEEMGADMPSEQNTDNLEATVRSIPTINEEQADRITNALLKTGDTMLGPLIFTEGENYGTEPPASSAEGTIFFIPQS